MISAVEMPTMFPRASVYPSLQWAPSSQKEAARCSSGPGGLLSSFPLQHTPSDGVLPSSPLISPPR